MSKVNFKRWVCYLFLKTVMSETARKCFPWLSLRTVKTVRRITSDLIVMVALWNRADHYIFALWFLLSFFFFSSPNLSGRRLDVCNTSTHGVALVRI